MEKNIYPDLIAWCIIYFFNLFHQVLVHQLCPEALLEGKVVLHLGLKRLLDDGRQDSFPAGEEQEQEVGGWGARGGRV